MAVLASSPVSISYFLSFSTISRITALTLLAKIKMTRIKSYLLRAVYISYMLNKKYFKKREKERSLYTTLATCDLNNSSLLNNKRFLECNRGSDEATIQSVRFAQNRGSDEVTIQSIRFAKNHSRSNKTANYLSNKVVNKPKVANF